MYQIGIIGQKKDEHVRSLAYEIEKHLARPLVIDFFNFPKFNLLTLNDSLLYDDIHILDAIPIKDLDLVYIRNFSGRATFSVKTRNNLRDQTLHETRILALEFCFAKIVAERIPVINDLRSTMFHRLKAYQYYLLASKGISVPKTIVTNNQDKIRAFISDLNHRVIAKPNTSAAEVTMADADFFERNQHVLESRPFIFQQYVNGRSFRAYLLGGRIISMGEIYYDRRFVDWRERVDRVIPLMPEEGLRKEIEKAVRVLGLAYCAVDIEYDNYSRKHYLLDFNPSALFTGWSRLVNMNMAGSIAEYLIDVLKRDGDIWQEH